MFLPLALLVSVIADVAGHADDVRGRGQGDDASKAQEQTIARGVTAGVVSIKQLGTNGGGYFGPNSTHPYENPTPLSNFVETWSITIIPMAMVVDARLHGRPPQAGGRDLRDDARASTCRWWSSASRRKPAATRRSRAMGVDQSTGSMEGKEVRFGAGLSALWAVTTTVTSNGSVNAMHDSLTPLGGLMPLDRHVAQQHLRRRRRRLHQHADLRHRRGVRRRA